MGWVLRLVETGTDTRAQSVDVMEISRPNDLRDLASLGLTLSEAKQLLARVQQAVVAAQARDHAALRPACSGCSGRCHVKPNLNSKTLPHEVGGLISFSFSPPQRARR